MEFHILFYTNSDENREIKERWTHEELINKNWVYKKMLDLQSGF